MIMTEKEARTKICPLLPCGRVAKPQPIAEMPPKLSLTPTNCVTNLCMLWMAEEDGRGECALVRRPR